MNAAIARKHLALLLVTLTTKRVDAGRHLPDEAAVVVDRLVQDQKDQATADRAEREVIAPGGRDMAAVTPTGKAVIATACYGDRFI